MNFPPVQQNSHSLHTLAAAQKLIACAAISLLATVVCHGEISYRNDVLPVLSKAGCNMGTCHGNLKGKGGFQLSLRSEKPDFDFEHLVKSKSSRRVMLDTPEDSLILKKPTEQLDHEGGQRFDSDSPEYAILRDWIAAGAKNDSESATALTAIDVSPTEHAAFGKDSSVTIEVTATFADGTTRNVSRWAVYEPSNVIVDISDDGIVTPLHYGETTVSVRYQHLHKPVRLAFLRERPDFKWEAPPERNVIDSRIFAKLRRIRTNPSEICDDLTFLRRASLDIAGRIPTADEAQAFSEDAAPEKRRRLVNTLLESEAFANFWAIKWCDILKIEEKTLDARGVKHFHNWVRDSLLSGKPLDAFARELVTSTGSTYRNPPTNFYRAHRAPIQRAEAAAQVFLGTRLQCARCHNHPYERWTQKEYYEFAAAFDGVEYDIVSNNRKDGFDKHMFKGEQRVRLGGRRTVRDPNTKKLPAPGLLGVEAPEIDIPEPFYQALFGKHENTSPRRNRILFHAITRGEPEQQRLQQVADWIVEHDLFARTQVNRIWYHMLGKGIVDPVDDLRSTNPPSNPELFDTLAAEFAKGGYDLKATIRRIANSSVYQLSSEPNATNGDDTVNFARSYIGRLGAEQLLDAVTQVLGIDADFRDHDKGTRAGELTGTPEPGRGFKPESGDHFLKTFGKPSRLLNSDAERTNETSLAQVFALTSGETLHAMLTKKDNRLGKMIAEKKSDAEVVDALFWSALCRPPTPDEADALLAYVAQAESRRGALEDITWGLINSKEFLFRR